MISTAKGQRGKSRAGCRSARDFRGEVKPSWCAGCGDFGVMAALHKALAAVGRPPHEIAFVSGVGCSSRIPEYTTAYGFSSLHGRALPVAQGIKLARPELLVLVAGGDGDGFAIGGGHVSHAIRRNPDLTYLVLDNHVHGLTDGQLSPTAPFGAKGPGLSTGSLESPVNPILYALSYGANFVAQGIASDLEGLSKVIEEAIRFPGFAFVNIESPCASFGDPDALAGVKVRSLEDEGHDPGNKQKAMELAQARPGTLYLGVFYRNPNPPPAYGTLVRGLQQKPARALVEALV